MPAPLATHGIDAAEVNVKNAERTVSFWPAALALAWTAGLAEAAPLAWAAALAAFPGALAGAELAAGAAAPPHPASAIAATKDRRRTTRIMAAQRRRRAGTMSKTALVCHAPVLSPWRSISLRSGRGTAAEARNILAPL